MTVAQAIKKNCTSYTESLETSATFLSAWERQQSIERFSNCSYHEIFTRFPQAPDGLYRFVFQNGQIVVATSLNGYDAAHYGPLPPVPPALASGEKSAAFLPVSFAPGRDTGAAVHRVSRFSGRHCSPSSPT